VSGPARQRCTRCGASLRSSNRSDICDPCRRTANGAGADLRLSDEFYLRADVIAALERYDFGAFFKAARAELGISQEALGLLLGMAQSHICKIENGGLRLRDISTIARLARLLRIPAATLGFAPAAVGTLGEGNDDQAVSWLDRRDFLTTVTTIALGASGGAAVHDRLAALMPAVGADPPRRVGLADVERIEATSRAFRDWDNRWGGGLSSAAVVAQLQWVIATGRNALCATEAVRDRLLVATADLANIAAWTNYDVEYHDEARRLWMIALDAAKEADNADLVGSVLRQLAHQALHLERPDEALRLVRLAYATTADPSHDVPELALAEIAAYEGWCYAAAGKARACDRAFGKAEEHFDNARDEEAPPWLGHFNYAELTALRGHSYHVLANRLPAAAAQAEPLLQDAVAGRGPGYARSKMLNLIALSSTYFQRGDGIEEGVRLGRQTLAAISTLNSPRALSRLRGLKRVTAPYASEPEVADFRHKLELVLADAA
jgi:transcriptional regulator with XRE-family HTH domain